MIVLLSGGLDSATVAAIARNQGHDLIALSVRYGQRHACELEAARNVAQALAVREHVWAEIDLRLFGGSALTADIAVPKMGAELGTRSSDAIPITYVPARNTIFLSYALALAEVREASDIYIGVNAVDYSGYPDCRPDFIRAFERMANLATRAAVEGRTLRIHTPLMDLSKTAIIRTGLALGVDYGLTRSCYDPDDRGFACGRCESCRFRLAAFAELGMNDPAPYRESAE